MASDTDFGALVERVDRLEQATARTARCVSSLEGRMQVFMSGYETVVSQIAEVVVAQKLAEDRKRTLEDELKQNTEMTREAVSKIDEVHDLVVTLQEMRASGRLTVKIGKAIGKLVLWGAPVASAAAGLWWALVHGPKK